LPLWSTGLQDPQNLDVDVANAAFDVKENKNEVHVSPSGSDNTKKHDDKAKRDDKGKSHADSSTGVKDLRAKFEEFSFNNTNRSTVISLIFGIAGKSSLLDPSKYPDDLYMLELEDIFYSDDEEDVGFEDPDYPDKVYKVVKALYGLHQAPIAWVLVTKPHNKTPYELLLGRSSSIGFMRPFGCVVTILNTLDPLGKFDEKADEGFLVGYSVNSKAFRVFNSRARIVQETLHINFLEHKPNVAGIGDLTYPFAKATLDESNLWHRRLGHINFKSMNKLVKGNLVRGLPSKIFENNHTCVACQKGKKHRASCKSKHVSSISHPLQRVGIE
nr:retrovirus-related Pol polyprotein from transposon TNT 1-94 [Tanacetum cinerariifolium]